MSGSASIWAWQFKLPATQKIILLALANWANEENQAWYSYNSIAGQCGLKRRCVIMNCKKLEELGFIVVEKRRNGEKNDTNLITLQVNETGGALDALVHEAHQGSALDAPGVVHLTTSSGALDAPEYNKNITIEYNNEYNSADAVDVQVEKPKESIKQKKQTPKLPDYELPDYVDADLFKDYLSVRKKIKAVNSDRAINSLIKKLVGFKDDGHDINEIIENAIVGSWKNLYPPKSNNVIPYQNNNQTTQPQKRSHQPAQLLPPRTEEQRQKGLKALEEMKKL